MLMKEFERTENELETKVVDTQKRFDTEQTKVKDQKIRPSYSNCFEFRSMNFKGKSMQKRKISIV